MPVPMGIRVFLSLCDAVVPVPGRPGAGRPGPFLWIPAKNCGNDKVGVGGNGQSEQMKNQQTSLPVGVGARCVNEQQGGLGSLLPAGVGGRCVNEQQGGLGSLSPRGWG